MPIIVQSVLVAAVLIVSFALMRGGANSRHLAIRRILLLVFLLSAILSIFFPEALSATAALLGIGRGTDLVLYAFIVCFLVYMSTSYQRFRTLESSLTKLARRMAISETKTPEDFAAEVQAAEDGSVGKSG